jgi:hypothetical protein
VLKPGSFYILCQNFVQVWLLFFFFRFCSYVLCFFIKCTFLNLSHFNVGFIFCKSLPRQSKTLLSNCEGGSDNICTSELGSETQCSEPPEFVSVEDVNSISNEDVTMLLTQCSESRI